MQLTSRPSLAALAVAVTIAAGVAVLLLQGGSAPRAAPAVAIVTRGDVVVSVGGVGRIAEAKAASQISVPGAAAGGGSATGSTAAGGTSGSPPSASSTSTGASGSASADSVFPRTSGRVSRLLVFPGRQVKAGQPLATLDDGGTAAGAVLQARYDVASALVDLRQKRTSDPLKGIPPTPQELAAANFAVTSSRARLAQVLGAPRPADVSAARLELKRAQADLLVLQGGRPADRDRAIAIAKHAVEVAQQRLDKLLAPPDPADVAAAELDLERAKSDLADLQRQQNPPATTEQLSAARKAVEAASLKLAKVLAPAGVADVSSARLELERAHDDLRKLQEGPTAAALASARQAVAAAHAKLKQLLGPPLHADVTLARLDVRKASADLSVLKLRGGPASAFDIDLARLKVEAARARLALAGFAARQLTVRAPADGTVTSVLTVPGAPVDASTPIATVAALQSLAVNVDLSEFDVARVKIGLPAMVSVDALGGRSFRGKVQFVGLTGVENGGVVTFPVRLGLQHVAGLKPGMNVSVHIVVARRRHVVQVPLEAVSRDTGGPTVRVLDATGKQVTRPVKLGLANNKNVEIKHGITAGQRVVLAGSQGG
jgi:multidrug efflux pump subunit AcrA (membrane-fusion protein)